MGNRKSSSGKASVVFYAWCATMMNTERGGKGRGLGVPISPCVTLNAKTLPPPQLQITPRLLVKFLLCRPFHRLVGAKNMIPPVYG